MPNWNQVAKENYLWYCLTHGIFKPKIPVRVSAYNQRQLPMISCYSCRLQTKYPSELAPTRSRCQRQLSVTPCYSCRLQIPIRVSAYKITLSETITWDTMLLVPSSNQIPIRVSAYKITLSETITWDTMLLMPSSSPKCPSELAPTRSRY